MKIHKICALCAVALAGCGASTDCENDVCTPSAGDFSSNAQALFGEIGGSPWGSSSVTTLQTAKPGADLKFGRTLGAGLLNKNATYDIVSSYGDLTSQGKVVVRFDGSATVSEFSYPAKDTGAPDNFGAALAVGSFCPDQADSDVIVASAPSYNNYSGAFGLIYRAKGAAANAPKLNRRINNNTSLELAGTQLAVGDVDGDGKADLVFQTQPMTPEYEYKPAQIKFVSDICTADAARLTNATVIDTAASADKNLLGSALYIVDLDGKGTPEIVAVDNLYNDADSVVSPRGAIHFYRMTADGKFEPSRKPILGDKTENSGASIESIAFADIDGDGDLDLIVGEPMLQTSFKREGRVRTYTNDGGDFDASKKLWSAVGGRSHARFGSSVRAVDLNNDGVLDLVVGAPGYRQDAENNRAQAYAYVYLGTRDGSGFSKDPYWTVKSDVDTTVNDDFGRSILAVNLNNSGWLDLVIAAPSTKVGTADNAGAIHLFNDDNSSCYRADRCMIDEKCYAAGETAADNKCQVCDPTKDNFGFVANTCEDAETACTQAATCDPAKGCQISNKPDSTVCIEASCDAVNNGISSGTCQKGKCVSSFTPCDTGSICQAAVCTPGCLSDANCLAGEQCVDGMCQGVQENRPPVITPVQTSYLVKPGDTVAFDVKASDPDGDPLTYAWTGTLAGALSQTDILNPVLYVPATQAEGAYSLVLTVTDDHGNAVSETFTIEVKTADSIQITEPEGDGLIEGPDIRIAGTTNVDGVVTVTHNDVELCQATVADSKWACTASLTPGSYIVVASITNDAGETITDDHAFEVIFPRAVKITQPTENETVYNTLKVKGTAEPDVHVFVRDVGSSDILCEALSDTDGHWDCVAGPNVGEGSHTIQASYVRSNGVEIVSASVTFLFVWTPPFILAPQNGSVVSILPQFIGTIEQTTGNVSVWSVGKDEAVRLCQSEIAPDKTWTCTADFNLEYNTAYTVEARWQNDRGLTIPSRENVTFMTEDNPAANIAILTPVDGAGINGAIYPVVFSGTADPGKTVRVNYYRYLEEVQDTPVSSCTALANDNGRWVCGDQTLEVGEYRAYAEDAENPESGRTDEISFFVYHENVFEPGYDNASGGSCSMMSSRPSHSGLWWLAGLGVCGLVVRRRRIA